MKQGGPLVMQGEGQGIITTKDGEGMATWTGHGIGRFTASGKISLGLRMTLSEQKKKKSIRGKSEISKENRGK